ncbi:MAG: MlaD family protein, partial [Bacteroidales bacterium]|nr:MlaD family protein [Bacteroidales bacterium]
MSKGKNTRFTKEWKIGLVSVAIIALFVWVCFFLAGRNILSSENTYYAVFDNSGGINISSPVVVNGKKVGRVSTIEFVSDTSHRIKMGIR